MRLTHRQLRLEALYCSAIRSRVCDLWWSLVCRCFVIDRWSIRHFSRWVSTDSFGPCM